MISLQKAGDFSVFQPYPAVVCSNPGSGEVGKQREQSGQVRCKYEDRYVCCQQLTCSQAERVPHVLHNLNSEHAHPHTDARAHPHTYTHQGMTITFFPTCPVGQVDEFSACPSGLK